MKTLYGLFFCLIVGPLMVSAPVSAQTAIQPLLATYDASQSVTKAGVITDLTWANTHCVLFYDVKNNDGSTTNLAIELTNPRTMIAMRVTPIILQPGRQISVTFSPSTDKPNRGLVKTMSMDGKVIFDTSKPLPEVDDYGPSPKKAAKKKSAS